MIDCEIITWSKDVVGKTLKNVMGLIYHGKEADYLHPQNLQFIFESASLKTIMVASDGESLLVNGYAMMESNLNEYGKNVILDVSSLSSFSQVVGKKLLKLGALTSNYNWKLVGLNFDFKGDVSLYILSLGDEIWVFNSNPREVITQENLKKTWIAHASPPST